MAKQDILLYNSIRTNVLLLLSCLVASSLVRVSISKFNISPRDSSYLRIVGLFRIFFISKIIMAVVLYQSFHKLSHAN